MIKLFVVYFQNNAVTPRRPSQKDRRSRTPEKDRRSRSPSSRSSSSDSGRERSRSPKPRSKGIPFTLSEKVPSEVRVPVKDVQKGKPPAVSDSTVLKETPVEKRPASRVEWVERRERRAVDQEKETAVASTQVSESAKRKKSHKSRGSSSHRSDDALIIGDDLLDSEQR